MKLYNTHVHTEYSHDSTESIGNHRKTALNCGLFGFAVTDHCDCEYSFNTKIFDNITASFIAAETAKKQETSDFIISAGVEIGDALFDKAFADRIISSHKFDVVLGSVHAARLDNWSMVFSTIDFSDKTDYFINKYLERYFEDVLETVSTTDFDVLSHLTVPLRYICKKYKRQVNVEKYYPVIKKILSSAVKFDKTLEINTSNYSPDDRFFMPDEKIIAMYLSVGGKDIILGSDAHNCRNINQGLYEAAAVLKKMGITELVYYSEREKHYYNI